jgi:hypothetical protein
VRKLFTHYEYNKQGEIVRATNSDGIVLETEYDKDGNIEKAYTYHKDDPTTRLYQFNSKEEGEENTAFTGYDEQGNLKSLSMADDGLDNPSKISYTKGKVTRVGSNGINYDYSYDNRGRQRTVGVSGANLPLVEKTYIDTVNANDTVISRLASGGVFVRVYDRQGKLTQVWHGTSRTANSGDTQATYTYDNQDRPVSTTGINNFNIRSIVYDDKDRVTRREENQHGATVTAAVTFANTFNADDTIKQTSVRFGTGETLVREDNRYFHTTTVYTTTTAIY